MIRYETMANRKANAHTHGLLSGKKGIEYMFDILFRNTGTRIGYFNDNTVFSKAGMDRYCTAGSVLLHSAAIGVRLAGNRFNRVINQIHKGLPQLLGRGVYIRNVWRQV